MSKGQPEPAPKREPEPLAVGVDEAARLLSVSRDAVYGAIRRGQLRSVQLGTRQLVPVIELHRFLGLDQPDGPTSTEVLAQLAELLLAATAAPSRAAPVGSRGGRVLPLMRA